LNMPTVPVQRRPSDMTKCPKCGIGETKYVEEGPYSFLVCMNKSCGARFLCGHEEKLKKGKAKPKECKQCKRMKQWDSGDQYSVLPTLCLNCARFLHGEHWFLADYFEEADRDG